MFHAVEVMLYHKKVTGNLGLSLRGEGSFKVRDSGNWAFVSTMLAGTAFWGHMVREQNWRARRYIVMCLLADEKAHAGQKAPARVRGLSPLLRAIGPDLSRMVVTYL